MIFYYYADHYINFKDLITELYRIYKTRIWLSAVNPASFSQHAMGQPPSGIGPGAITNNNGSINTSYTMAYGADPDPYGAVPPYRLPYDTYDPNYPSIPGVQNSYAPGGGNGFTPTAPSFQPATDATNAAPTIQPGGMPTGSTSDYNYFYERAVDNLTGLHLNSHQLPSASATMPTPPSGIPYQPFNMSGMPYNPMPNMARQLEGMVHTGYGNYLPSPWNNGSTAVNPAAAGLGRQADIPQPIGTRPKSNGNAARPLSNNKNEADYMGHQLRVGQEAAAYDNSPMPAARYGALPTWASNTNPHMARDMGARVANISSWRPVNGPENESKGRKRPPGYADEMSRER